MKGIDRVSLYMNVQNILEERNESYSFIFKYFEENFIKKLFNVLKLNIIILRGIEEKFLIDSSRDKFDKAEFKLLYTKNINQLKAGNDFLKDRDLYKLESFINTINKSSDEFYAFNSLINLLNDISNANIKNTRIDEGRFYSEQIIDNYRYKNQVFLSHAFDDKLYTLSLFIFMLEKDIFLYVDWIFSSEFNNGVDIKRNLFKRILHSDQLLFLRTVNSEFSIRGNGNIRGWCSWELGAFYSTKDIYSKFYIELYKSKTIINHKQLDGIKPLKDIRLGRLV